MPKTPTVLNKLASNLKSSSIQPERKGPLWQGPCAEGPLGGITFSMLSRFLSCRERFRVQYVEGIKPAERFNHRTDYGTMWHLCEEHLAKGQPATPVNNWALVLENHCKELARKFPLQQEEIGHWYHVCLAQFPVYVEHWSKHQDVKKRVPLMQEQVFDVPYKLPSGRTVRLRGKFDSVDLIDGGVWLQENKTKGDVDIQAIQRQLTFDLQTMMYLSVLHEAKRKSGAIGVNGRFYDQPIKGVRYNVVRRPLSGGKGTIVRHKATKNKPEETWEEYYGRVEQVIRENPDHFFQRWNTEITPHDIQRFQRECLNPILEQLCEWYECMKFSGGQPFKDHYNCHDNHGIHYRHPFGVVNIIDEYGSGDTDAYIDTKSMAGLRRVNTLFEELV